jgi:hypothetical protein
VLPGLPALGSRTGAGAQAHWADLAPHAPSHTPTPRPPRHLPPGRSRACQRRHLHKRGTRLPQRARVGLERARRPRLHNLLRPPPERRGVRTAVRAAHAAALAAASGGRCLFSQQPRKQLWRARAAASLAAAALAPGASLAAAWRREADGGAQVGQRVAVAQHERRQPRLLRQRGVAGYERLRLCAQLVDGALQPTGVVFRASAGSRLGGRGRVARRRAARGARRRRRHGVANRAAPIEPAAQCGPGAAWWARAGGALAAAGAAQWWRRRRPWWRAAPPAALAAPPLRSPCPHQIWGRKRDIGVAPGPSGPVPGARFGLVLADGVGLLVLLVLWS